MRAKRVSIFINEGDKWHGRPLHLALLEALAKEGMAGATVVRGVAGYARSAGIATTSLVGAGGRLPLVIEFIESEDNVERMMPVITEMVGSRLVTTMDVDIRLGGAFKPWGIVHKANLRLGLWTRQISIRVDQFLRHRRAFGPWFS